MDRWTITLQQLGVVEGQVQRRAALARRERERRARVAAEQPAARRRKRSTQ